MSGLSWDKPLLPGKILRLLDEPHTDSDTQSTVSDVDYAKKLVMMMKVFLRGI
jgi:hypothetical protein